MTQAKPKGVQPSNDFLDHLRHPPAPVRPTWDEVWMDTAKTIARRSLDPRHQVGAVIVTDDNTQVLSVGDDSVHNKGPNSV